MKNTVLSWISEGQHVKQEPQTMDSKRYSYVFMYFVAVVVILVPASTQAQALTHQLRLTNATGQSLTFVDDQPNLETDVLGTIHEVCNQGVWAMYSGTNYDVGSTGIGSISLLFGLELTCINWASTSQSARRVGNLTDNTHPSVTVYTRDGFRGETTIFEEDIPQLDFLIASLVTINTNVEFFLDPNYEGGSYCLNLEGQCIGEVCMMIHIDLFNLPFPPELAKSVKLGCNISSPRAHVSKATDPMITSVFHQIITN